jgi:hypothetical protein
MDARMSPEEEYSDVAAVGFGGVPAGTPKRDAESMRAVRMAFLQQELNLLQEHGEQLRESKKAKQRTLDTTTKTMQTQSQQMAQVRDGIFLLRSSIKRLMTDVRQQCISMPLVVREIPNVDPIVEGTADYDGLTERQVRQRLYGYEDKSGGVAKSKRAAEVVVEKLDHVPKKPWDLTGEMKPLDTVTKDLLRTILKAQCARPENHEFLQHLMGEESRANFEIIGLTAAERALQIYFAGKDLQHHIDPAESMTRYLHGLMELTNSDSGAIYQPDEVSGDLIIRCVAGHERQKFRELHHQGEPRVKKGTGIVGRVCLEGEPVLLADGEDETHPAACLCVPIFFGEHTGCMIMYDKHAGTGKYTRLHLEAVSTLAALIAPGLAYPQWRHRDEHKTRRVFSQAVSTDNVRAMNPLVQEVMLCIGFILSCESCSLFMADHNGKVLWSTQNDAEKGGNGSIVELPIDHGIVGTVFTKNESLLIEDCKSNAQLSNAVDLETGYQVRCMLCSPVRHFVHGYPIGVLRAVNRTGGTFTAEDEAKVEKLCRMLCTMLYASEYFEDLSLDAELQERIFLRLAIPTVVITASGRVAKLNDEVAQAFCLASHADWVGKHVAEVFGPLTPYLELFELWCEVVVSEDECFRTVHLPLRPGEDDKNRETRKAEAMARMQPSKSENDDVIGIIMTVSQSSRVTPYYPEEEDDDSESSDEVPEN